MYIICTLYVKKRGYYRVTVSFTRKLLYGKFSIPNMIGLNNQIKKGLIFYVQGEGVRKHFAELHNFTRQLIFYDIISIELKY